VGEDRDWTSKILEALDKSTAIVTLPNCHWTDGALIDLVKVGRRAREVGAALVLDLTQSASALPIALDEIMPDFATFAGYKWPMGPYSLGYLYVSDRWAAEGQPLEENWIARADAVNFAALVDYKDRYQPGARRFDMGERSNFHLMPMAEAALTQILDWGIENIYESLVNKTDALVAQAEALGLRAAPSHLRAGHYLGLQLPDRVPSGLVERLAERKIFVSLRGTSIRITPHLYNNDEDLAHLIEALG
jgi:selenocysteine lyase/cysteine desulfurase